MAIHNITGPHLNGLKITVPQETWNVAENATIFGPTAAGIYCSGERTTLNVAGDVQGIVTGITIGAHKFTLNLESTSSVLGFDYGVQAAAKKMLVASLDGQITGSQYGFIGGSLGQGQLTTGADSSISGLKAGLAYVAGVSAHLQLNGAVLGGEAGLIVGGDGNATVDIGTHALISGQTAFQHLGKGEIVLHNDGEIVGNVAFQVFSQSKIEIVNGVHGSISGASSVIDALATSVDIVNHGTIASPADAGSIQVVAKSTNITNDGLIIGSVMFAGGTYDGRGGVVRGDVGGGIGNETFDMRDGAVVTGSIIGGTGNDTLIVDDAKVTMVENKSEGHDTVQSTVSYTLGDNIEQLNLLGAAAINGTGNSLVNKLHGNDGANDLRGLGGDDKLYGGKGDDRLFGGEGKDVFYFSTGDGKDKIMDYVDGIDTVDLRSWKVFKSFNDMMDHHAADVGDGVLISFGHDSLLIHGAHKTDLSSHDILV